MTKQAFLSRRRLLSGMCALAGASLSGCSANFIPPEDKSGDRSISDIGLHLAAISPLFRDSPADAIRTVAGIGYAHVEFGGGDYLARNHSELRRVMDGEGVSAPAMHVEIGDIITRPDRIIAIADTLGCKYIVIAQTTETLSQADNWPRLAALYNVFGMRALTAGKRCVYLHSELEFRSTGMREGRSVNAFDYILGETDPALVDFELDSYAATRAGVDFSTLFRTHKGRFPLWHLRDMTQNGADTDIGDGVIDFAALFAAANASAPEHVFVTHGNHTHNAVLTSISRSHAALQRIRY